jgi:hypothetical protein
MKFVSAALFALCCWAPGCQSHAEEPAVVDAFQSFVAAIRAQDAGRLYDLAPKALRQKLDSLHTELFELVVQVEREYPKAEVAATLEGIAAELLDGAESGRDLAKALIDFSALHGGAGTDEGLAINTIWVGDEKASLTTRAGETFPFFREGGAWVCGTLLIQLDQNPSLKRLRANMRIVAKNLAAWKSATRETTDQTKPAGVFNVVVEAVRRAARVKVYELLDAESLKLLEDGSAAVRRLQHALEKRFPGRAQRAAYLVKRKLAWIELVRGPKALFAGLWDSGNLKNELPFIKEVTIRAIHIRNDSTALLTAATGAGERRIEFKRATNGRWKLSALVPVLHRVAIRGMETELTTLANN